MASIKAVSFYSIIHFIVDFSCAFLMFRFLSTTMDWYQILFVYNFCAFAMQMPIGLLADRLNKNALVTACGCAFVAASFGCTALPIFAAVIAGIGNAFFHIGAGIEVLNLSNKKIGLLGIFVSPGAFGIYLGTILGKQLSFPYIICRIILITVVFLILYLNHKKQLFTCKNDSISLSFSVLPVSVGLFALICILCVVILRSYVGFLQGFPWKSQPLWGFFLITAVVIGKMSGGLIADKIGLIKTAVFSLGLCSLLFMFSDYPLVGIFAMFLFNMTMPITLFAVSQILPAAKGFSFGILTFGLFIGFLPTYLNIAPLFSVKTSFVISCVVSFVLLTMGLRRLTK